MLLVVPDSCSFALTSEVSQPQLSTLRGMSDIFSNDILIWQRIEDAARSLFRKARVSEIRTPLVEATSLFCRTLGQATDVVGKEMYTFLDRSERSCTLRPEGTASVVRSVVQHGLLSRGPQRLWYSGPMFRYERPQAGRQRQFHQIGLEYIGFHSAHCDTEVISLAWELLMELGIGGLALELNTLGSADDRARYRHQLVDFFQGHRDQLDPDSLDRLERNPLRILDSKHPQIQGLLAHAPVLSDALDASSQDRFEQVQAGLAALGIPFQVNHRLVRGLDYYNHTAFEITSSQLGAQSTVCGGGRYDGLVEQLGGPSSPAIGWALGIERLVLLLAQSSTNIQSVQTPDLYVVNRGESVAFAALLLSRNLRSRGLSIELDPGESSFAKQFKRADRSGATWAAVLGEEELAMGMFQLKPLRDPNLPISTYPLGDLGPLVELLRK